MLGCLPPSGRRCAIQTIGCISALVAAIDARRLRYHSAVMRALRPLIYLWTLPTSIPGLLLAFANLIAGGKVRIVNGVLEAHGPVTRFWLTGVVGLVLANGAAAMTLGHVVLGVDQRSLDRTREHERIHVHQAECWGPFFIPAYLLASFYQWIRGRRAYRDNPFERDAFDHSDPHAPRRDDSL